MLILGNLTIERELNAHLTNEEPSGIDAQLENEKPTTTDIKTDAMSLQDKISCVNNIPHAAGCSEPNQEGNTLFITSNKRFKKALISTFRRIERTSNPVRTFIQRPTK